MQSETKTREMTYARLKDVKKGEFFRISASDTAPVWIRDEYNRSTHKYECYKFDDMNHLGEFNGTRMVIVDFEF